MMSMERIGIIGGGITGLTAAYYLSKKGFIVTVFESDDLGGLSGSFKINGHFLEKYYHHFFEGDRELLDLIDELNLNDKIIWNPAKLGFFYNGKVHSLTNATDLLKFEPLSFSEKMKLGLSISRLKKIKNWRDLENVSAKAWFLEHCGEKVCKVIWEPLLKTKFGTESENVSAAWVWGRIKARIKPRFFSKERLGYLHGSFQILINKLEREILRNKGKIVRKGVKKIIKGDGEIYVKAGKGYSFEKVISTVPLPVFIRIAKGLPKQFINNLEKTKYRAVVCLVLELKNTLGDIYWLNINDDIGLGGVIEHTNFVPNEMCGSNIIYLFNYTDGKGDLYNLPNKDIFQRYTHSLKSIFPDFKINKIKSFFVFRNKYASPVYTINYSKQKPDFKTPIKNLFVANTSQIYPHDRNVNNCVKMGENISEMVQS